MKKSTIIFMLMAIASFFGSCDGMGSSYEEFIKDGPIVYIGKADSLKVSGRRMMYPVPVGADIPRRTFSSSDTSTA